MMSEGKDREGEGPTNAVGSPSDDQPTTRPADLDALDDERLGHEPPMPVLKLEESPQRLLGRLLSGRYRIEAHLGAGGFGDVFRAVHEKTGQLVAIKLLRPRYGKGVPSMERQLARFRREMRVCAELHHAHIVKLIDSGETDNGMLFSVFEYVPGMTLAELLREKGALTVRSTIELLSQVLDALICAHGRGIIHRDLKPNNIMVSTTGTRPQTTVLDFGISAFREGMLVDEWKSLTVTKEILGTPSYAAPEQLRGEAASVKSDLYAWGLVFLECLLGRRVLEGASSHEIAYRQLSADPVPMPVRLQKHWLGTLLRWVLEKDVSRRAGDGALLMERLLEKRPLGDLVDAHGYLIQGADRFEVTPGAPLPSDEPTSNSLGTQAIGERRQITAVCCAVALNAAAAGQPPELLDQLLRDALSTCLEVATRYGGFPASNLGGQVLLYFGFPRASDTDARRSGIVALEIAHELRRRSSEMGGDMPVEIKIGIHTGMVTTLGLDARSSSPVFGVTPARAVQLAAEAPSNGILVSSDSFRTLAPSFELSPITSTSGEAVYRLLAESRAESAAASASAPFVGRAHELDHLRAAWERARKAEGATLMLAGEAGIGKSRLARELRQDLQGRQFGWIETRCLPEMQNSALRPLIDLLQQQLNLTGDGVASARRLEASLRELQLEPKEAMPLLCPWLGLPLEAPYQPLLSSPQKQKALLLDLLVRLIMALSERHVAPVLIEDLLWADPTTRELCDLLVERVVGRRVLLLLTARCELPKAFSEDLVEVVQLHSLEPAAVQQIVGALTNGRKLPGQLVEQVIERADGIPLYVEEIVHFIEQAEPSSSSSSSASGAPLTEVPGKLRDLLTGRLDRLGRAREVAQVAAVIGREFDYRLLAALVAGEEGLLLADLEKMVSADLIVRRRHVDNPVYMFRHALIRDAAYESLPRKVQQQLHQKIAETLAAKFPEVAEAQPELMAAHLEGAGLVGASIDQWLRAGQRGLHHAANRETIAHVRRALALLEGIVDPGERARRELDLQLTLAPALMAIEGWASPATGAACTRARDLCQALEDQQRLFAALFGLWTFQFVGGNLGPALVTARETLALAEAEKSPAMAIVGHHAVGFSQLYRGEFADAMEHGARGLAHYEPEQEREITRSFQLSSTSCCAYFRAASLWMRGFPEDAEKGLSAMYAVAAQLDHAPSTSSIMGFALFLHHYQQDVERTRRVADELFALSNEHGFQNWLAVSFIYRAWARTRQGELEQGIGELRFGIQQFRAIGARLILVGVHAMLGEALLAAGRPDEALAALAEGIGEATERDEHLCEPELFRLRGEALRGSDPSAAEASFAEALRLSRAQEARSLSLRAAVGLARLLSETGARRAEARALLEAECAFFTTQGQSTEDFKAARALQAALAEAPPPEAAT